jgi:5'-nucleotidase
MHTYYYSGMPDSDSMKKILYIDMDNVLVNFKSALDRVPTGTLREFNGRPDDIPGIFALMDPMPQAIESFNELSTLFDTYILSTAPWENLSAWSDKLFWVKRHLGAAAYKRLILTHHKNLNAGDYLIDDCKKHGVDSFPGEHIQFGGEQFPDWPSVLAYLRCKAVSAV